MLACQLQEAVRASGRQLPHDPLGALQIDFGYFGPPEEHKQWTGGLGPRLGTHITPQDPSSEICGEVAAAMAASAVAMRQTDPAYADTLIEHAKQMYEFGRKYQGSYMDSKLAGLKDHAKHYPSSNWVDEMAWGAIWLHFATGVSALNMPREGAPSACQAVTCQSSAGDWFSLTSTVWAPVVKRPTTFKHLLMPPPSGNSEKHCLDVTHLQHNYLVTESWLSCCRVQAGRVLPPGVLEVV